jgi:hypothetical protein
VLHTHSERMTLPYDIDVWKICSNGILLDYSIINGEFEHSRQHSMDLEPASTYLSMISLHGVIPSFLLHSNDDLLVLQTYLENLQRSIQPKVDRHQTHNHPIPKEHLTKYRPSHTANHEWYSYPDP